MKLIVKIPSINICTISYAIIFFIWTFNFLWPSIGLSLISRLGDIGWLFIISFCFLTSGRFRSIFLKLYPFFVFFLTILFFSFLLDAEHPYKLELYFKTALYVPLAFVAGTAFANHFIKKELAFDHFVFLLGWATLLLVFLYSVYVLFLGWRVGQSMLDIKIAEYYQGISRIMAAAAMIIVIARNKLPEPLVVASLGVCLIIIIGLSGIGGMVGLLLAVVWFVSTTIFDGKRKNTILKLSYVFVVISIIAYVAFNIGQGESNIHFTQRVLEKLGDQDLRDSRGRPWLMMQGLTMWLSGSLKDFICGPGLMNYSNAIGFFQDYRHPHNLLIAGVVWFGLLFIPFILFMAFILLKSIRSLFLDNKFINFIALMFLNYFILSMVGGDFEQNRHIFFMMGSVFYFSIFAKRAPNNKVVCIGLNGLKNRSVQKKIS